MKPAIFGVGQMGRCIASAMEKLGHELTIVDSSEDSLSECGNILGNFSKHNFIHYHDTSEEYYEDLLDDVDIVISALPYHQSSRLARYCIRSGVRYCDLGGSDQTSNAINNFALKGASKPVMTDVGLAPGWINILTEHVYSNCVAKKDGTIPQTVEMMVGGIPKNPNNLLKYTCTWSVDGLINEYKGNCLVLKHGLQDVVSALGGLSEVSTSVGDLECFYTSGGASNTIDSMQKRGVENCHYKTMRWPGHRDIVKFLIHECGHKDEDLKRIFSEACKATRNINEDLVVMRVSIDEWVEEKVINSDLKWSAMQKATAFPTAAIATIIGDGSLDSHRVLSYENIPYKKFSKMLDKLLQGT
jgi:saccharopine dehydrogenase-like NADP-dependent oxidoreductase